MFRVDEPRVLHELAQTKMAEDAERIGIVLFVLSSEVESSSEEDDKVSASKEEAVTETESANEIVYKKT